jgi:DNA-binding transcriptional MerR regulator
MSHARPVEDRVCEPAEATYSLGAVTRLTGLSAHVLRAWERRYRAVEPLRTAGGTRRYRESDVARLRLLRAATDAGHPIGDIAGLPNRELERRLAVAEEPPAPPLTAFLEAAEELDAGELERLLSVQLATLGPRGFTRLVALPLLREIGERWAAGKLGIASEHLASATCWVQPCVRPVRPATRPPFSSRPSRASCTNSAR